MTIYFSDENKRNNNNNNSSEKQSDLGHFLIAQGKFVSPFPCTLFLHIFNTQKLEIELLKVSQVALFHAVKDIIEIII